MKIRILQYRDVIESMRFDGSYHNADVNVYDSVIKKHSHHKLSHYCSEIFSTGRNKRTYTTPEFGYPFLSNSDVVAAEPFMSCKYCSRKYDFDDKAVLKAGMILTGRVGAIGQTSFVPSYLEKAKAMGSDNIIRIVVKSEYRKDLYMLIFLLKWDNSHFGNTLLEECNHLSLKQWLAHYLSLIFQRHYKRR